MMHNEDYAKQVGKMKSQRSYWKYCTVYNHLEEFIKHRYKVSDIALRELSPAFMTDFELFLRTEKSVGIIENFIHTHLLVNFHYAFISLWLPRYIANIIFIAIEEMTNRRETGKIYYPVSPALLRDKRAFRRAREKLRRRRLF